MAHLKPIPVITLVSSVLMQAGCPSPRASSEPVAVDGRDAASWTDRVIAYCEYQLTGLPRRERNHPLRVHYNGIIFAVNSVKYFDEDRVRVHAVLPELNPAPALLPHELDYQTWRRDSLAMALVAENPNLTDYKLLKGLPKPKLARLLAETRKRNAETLQAVTA